MPHSSRPVIGLQPESSPARVVVQPRAWPAQAPALVQRLIFLSLLLSLALLAVLLVGCDGPSPTGPGPGGIVAFQNVTKAFVANRTDPLIRRAVRDRFTWASVWLELWGPGAPALPEVDFDREMVIVATSGQICFGDVTVEAIVNDSALVVRLAEAQPTLCLCAAPELTFQAVRLPRLDREPRFESRTVPPRCPS